MIYTASHLGGEHRHLVLLAVVLSLLTVSPAFAAEPASPTVEVKFFLKPSEVLNTNSRPNDALRKAFKISTEKKPAMIGMQFLDGPTRDLHRAGWNIRFRKIQGQDHIELTFKRRYPVNGSLKAVLEKAEQDGLGAASSNEYEAELEWGYQRQTLTFANEKRAGDAEEQSLTLPSDVDAQHLAVNKIPDMLKHWKDEGWANGVLSGACLYGPVNGWRWHGSHAEIDDKIVVEVWALPASNRAGTEHIIEISFKKKHDADAMAKRQKLQKLLTKKGWLLEKDVLKTTLILERSRQSNC